MILFCRGQNELLSPVVRDDVVTIAARRRKKVACILHFKALFINDNFAQSNDSTRFLNEHVYLGFHDQ